MVILKTLFYIMLEFLTSITACICSCMILKSIEIGIVRNIYLPNTIVPGTTPTVIFFDDRKARCNDSTTSSTISNVVSMVFGGLSLTKVKITPQQVLLMRRHMEFSRGFFTVMLTGLMFSALNKI